MDGENTTPTNMNVSGDGDFKTLVKGLGRNINRNLRKRVNIVLSALLIFVGILAVNYYYRYQLVKDDPQKVVQEESRELVAAVSRLIVLPDGEEPTVATISDLDALKDQVFFAKAKLGDKVLIYTNARKAILYDPEANKIVEVAPLTIGNPTK